MPLESHHQPRDGIESHKTRREQDGDRESKKKNLRLGTEALQHQEAGSGAGTARHREGRGSAKTPIGEKKDESVVSSEPSGESVSGRRKSHMKPMNPATGSIREVLVALERAVSVKA